MAGATLAAVGSNEMGVSKVDGTFEMMVSPYTKYIKATKEGFVSVQAEVDGSYLVFKLLVDKKYLENKAKAEEAARLAAEAKTKAEEEARLAEEKRLAAEKAAAEKAEQERIAAEARARLAEEKRIAAEKLAAEKAEAARLAAEEKARIAEEKRIAAEKAAEEKRIAAEKVAAEKARLAEEKRRLEEEKRLAAEKAAAEKAERERLAAEERARIAAEQARLAEQQRLANEQNLSEIERTAMAAKRVAEEKAAADKLMKAEARKANAKEWQMAKLKGYRSMVEVSGDMSLNLDMSFNVSYIGGYQINNYFYVGAGVGVGFNANETDSQDYSYIKDCVGVESLPLNTIKIPVFGYFRANFLDGRCAPFFALTVGYNFGTTHNFYMPWNNIVRYSTGGVFINPQIGVNYRLNKKYDLYLAFGFNLPQVPSIDWDKTTQFKAEFTKSFYRGFDFHVGFTF